MRVVLDNITHNYQRPPSVGMPRHALRQRMPNSATGRPYLLGGWGGTPQSSRPRGGPRLAALRVQVLYLPQVGKKVTKSEMNRRISLKLCTQVKEQILRTFSCWHFSEKNVLHGFFWFFFGFFSSFSSLINQSPNQRLFSA